MKKPRIILADTDENYIDPLEEKFLSELGNLMDLELITSPEYFNELFAEPQSADILAVSEDLFSRDLIKHDIKSLFLLAEDEEGPDSGQDSIIRLFKYSSLKEIYGRIMAFSNISTELSNVRPKKTMVIMVYSASGGTGKTTLSMGISMCMAQNFRKVLYVNADRMNSFQYHMTDRTPLPTGIYAGITRQVHGVYAALKPYIRNERFDYLPPFAGALSSVNVDYGFYERFIREAAEAMDYDVIIIDADVVFDEYKAALAAFSDRVILVSTQSAHSQYATELLVGNMNCSNNEKFYFICNGYVPENHNDDPEKQYNGQYVTDEFISIIDGADTMSLSELGRNMDIQKISFLME